MSFDHIYSKVRNQDLNENLFNLVVSVSNKIPVHQNLRIRLTSLSAGQAELTMEIGPEFLNSYGLAHGGILATFADSAMGVALRTLNLKVVTLEMNINYFAPVQTGEFLMCTAKTVHTGSRISVVETEIVNKKQQLVAKSRATFFHVGVFSEATF